MKLIGCCLTECCHYCGTSPFVLELLMCAPLYMSVREVGRSYKQDATFVD